MRKIYLQRYRDKDLLKNISQNEGKDIVWLHAASLGEFYQGRAIIQKIKTYYKNVKIIQTFFSPSGYESINDPIIDYKFYLPIDTPKNAKNFIKNINPKLVIFVKYEFWPNYILTLIKQNIPLIFISTVFRENQFLFKPYGRWIFHLIKQSYKIFLQDPNSLEVLRDFEVHNASLAGDTRFDTVWDNSQKSHHITKIENFCKKEYLFIAGSTWQEDEEYLMPYIEKCLRKYKNWKFIIAPHDVSPKRIRQLIKRLPQAICYSDGIQNADSSVMILDTIGILRHAYSYADLAYVGGGFSDQGLHNILEPASFGVPVFFGSKHKKFWEAKALIQTGGGGELRIFKDFEKDLQPLMMDDEKRREMSKKTLRFITEGRGSSEKIFTYIQKNNFLK